MFLSTASFCDFARAKYLLKTIQHDFVCASDEHYVCTLNSNAQTIVAIVVQFQATVLWSSNYTVFNYQEKHNRITPRSNRPAVDPVALFRVHIMYTSPDQTNSPWNQLWGDFLQVATIRPQHLQSQNHPEQIHQNRLKTGAIYCYLLLSWCFWCFYLFLCCFFHDSMVFMVMFRRKNPRPCAYNLAPMERDCFSTPREIFDLGDSGTKFENQWLGINDD